MTRNTRTDESASESETDGLTRRRALQSGAAALASMPFAGTVAAESEPRELSPLAASGVGYLGYELPEAAVQYGSNGDPALAVAYSEGSRESLIEWVDADDRRRLIAEHEPSRTATVAAPPDDLGLGGRLFNRADGLVHRDYIERADLNIQQSLTEPVVPASGDEIPVIDREQLSYIERLRTDPVDAAGVAYDGDFERTMLQQARQAMAATSDDLGGLPDTSSLRIAVADTGVNHADGAIFGTDGSGTPRIGDASKDFVSDDEPTVGEEDLSVVIDRNGHGSWVAGAMTASPDPNAYPDGQGFLPAAEVLALRTLDGDGGGESATIARAVRYAADNDADIVCLSLGSAQWSDELDAACTYATENGCIPVAATGNDRQMTTWVAHPASSDATLAVAATTVKPPSEAKSAYFANIGPHPGTTDFSGGESTDMQPDVAAPGTELGAVAADEQGTVSTRYLTGTSMAAPCVAGVAGLLIAATSLSEYEEVRDRLSETARPVPAAGEFEVGHGVPSAKHAINNDTPETAQADARDDDAVARDEAYRRYANAQGRQVTGFFG